MPNFRATVRILEVTGDDMLSARRALEERLQAAGIGRWHVLNIAPAKTKKQARARVRWRRQRYIAGQLMLVAAALWALWYLWLLAE